MEIVNQDPVQAYDLIYMDVLPWQMQVYSHTLSFEKRGAVYSFETQDALGKDVPFAYAPAKNRQRPTLFETQFRLGPQSSVKFSLVYDKLFMGFTEYPFDPNRGMDIGAAKLIVKGTGGSQCDIISSTDTLLLTLPTPDFTMPFNVITFTCTLTAVFYGSLFNLVYRKFSICRS